MITYNKIIWKLLLCVFITGFFFLFIQNGASAANKEISITVDGKTINSNPKPYVDNQNRTMVPIRFVGEKVGFAFEWDSVNKAVSFTGNGILINLYIGQKEAKVNGKTVKMDTNAVIKQGRAMVPLRFVLENLGMKVEFDKVNNVVSISTSGTIIGSESKMAVISKDSVNVRKGPGTNYSIVTQVKKGETFKVLAQQDDWYQIVLNNGGTGWVAGWLVAINRDGTDLPSRSEEPGEDRNTDTPDNNLVSINKINVDTEEGNLILTVNGDNKLTYATFSLDNPRRLVLDFPQSILKTGSSGISIPANELVKDIRIAQFSENKVRIVLDVTGTACVNLVSSSSNKTSLTFKIEKSGIAGKIIVIDPGHASIQPGGWSDPGAVGPSKLYEKDVVLDIALKVKQILEKKGAKPILTRTGDTTLTLSGRANIANQNNADIFVSIHANSNTSRTPNGTSTYYYDNGNGQGQARKKLASAVQKELVKAIQRRDIGVLTANFAVLRYTQVPSILVETAFISNYEEEQLLADPAFRTKVAQGIANGIEQYFIN